MEQQKNILWRLSFDPNKVKLRKYTAVYLSEKEDGTLEGTEKMSLREYATRQKFLRMAMGIHAEGLFFAQSQEAVAHRARRGLLKHGVEFGKKVVWEAKGERPYRSNAKRKK